MSGCLAGYVPLQRMISLLWYIYSRTIAQISSLPIHVVPLRMNLAYLSNKKHISRKKHEASLGSQYVSLFRSSSGPLEIIPIYCCEPFIFARKESSYLTQRRRFHVPCATSAIHYICFPALIVELSRTVCFLLNNSGRYW